MEAGLPNIAGNILFARSMVNEVSGVIGITQQGVRDQTQAQSGGRTINGIDFDAYRSSSIYGSSTTVTPLSMSCIFCISY